MPRIGKTAPPPPPGYVWSDEAARRMSVAVKTLWNYRHLGKGPQPVRYRGRLAYSEAEIAKHLEAEFQALAEQAAKRAHDSRPAEPRIAA